MLQLDKYWCIINVYVTDGAKIENDSVRFDGKRFWRSVQSVSYSYAASVADMHGMFYNPDDLLGVQRSAQYSAGFQKHLMNKASKLKDVRQLKIQDKNQAQAIY